MSSPSEDQTRLMLAALFGALAQTLGEHDESFVRRFDKNLRRISQGIEDHRVESPQAFEALRLTHEMLRDRL